MSIHEQPGNDLESFSLESPTYDDEFVKLLYSVIFRQYDEGISAGFKDEVHNLDVDESLELVTRDKGNEFAVQSQDEYGEPISDIIIGYFNPGTGLPELYPEYIKSDEEKIIVQAAAIIKREQDIKDFNLGEDQNKVRLDYEDAGVQNLHEEHNEYLDNGILEDLLFGYNSQQIIPEDRIEMDSSTYGAICLLPDLGVGLRITGGFTVNKGFKFRKSNLQIKIADRVYDPENMDADYELAGEIIESVDVNGLKERIQEVIDLSGSLILEGKVFDTSELGIRTRPQG